MFINSLWLGLSLVVAIVVCGEGTQTCKPLEFSDMATDMATDTKTMLALVDQRVVLACELKVRRRDSTIMWYKDGKKLSHGIRIRVKKHGQYLKIISVQNNDTGHYSCEAFLNDLSCGKSPTLKKTFGLVVTGTRPSFSIDTTRRFFAIPAGSSVRLDCSANGSYPLAVKWLKDGLPASNRHKTLQQFQLRVSTARVCDAGDYTCNVSNAYGWISHSYKLHVKERLRAKPIVLPLSNVTAWVGDNFEIVCWALSDLMPSFQWMQWFSRENGTLKYKFLMGKSEEFVVKASTTVIASGAFDYAGVRLIALNVSTQLQGRYSCVVGNAVGYTVRHVYVTVLGKKGPGDCSGAVDGYYPHVSNCSTFVVCKDGVSEEKSCPSGLVWDKHHRFCDLAKNVSC